MTIKYMVTAPEFMHEAIRLSLDKMRAGCGGPFGAVIAKERRLIGMENCSNAV